MANEAEIKRTGWVEFGHHGVSHYRIWKQQDGHRWFQRHEWKREDGSIEMDDWIPSAGPFGLTFQDISGASAE